MRYALLIRREWVAARRDRRLLLLCIALIALLGGALVTRAGELTRTQQERARARDQFRAAWLQQGTRNAHDAAHYGTVVMKPVTALAVFEAGMERYMGTTVTLVAHQQSDAAFPPASDSGATQRFGDLQPGLVMALLLPLLVILLGHEAMSVERRAGTIPLLWLHGVSTRQLLVGKILGGTTLLLAAMLVAMGLTFPAWGPLVLTVVDGGVAARIALLLVVWGSYLVAWMTAAVVLTAALPQRGRALLVLLVLWAVTGLLVPRLAVTVAAAQHPVPTRLEFARAMAAELRRTFNGHDADSVMMAAIEKEAFAQYGVHRVEDLPINLDGMLMQRGEEATSRVFDRHFADLNAQLAAQRQVVQWSAFLSPYLAVRTIAASLAGADHAHHVHFLRAVERYRLSFVQRLNSYQTMSSRTGDWSAPTRASLWAEIPDFAYALPSLRWSLAHVRVEGLVLALLLGGLLFALWRTPVVAGDR